MLFIFDMGGVVTSTFQMELLYEKLNMTKEDFFTICNCYGTHYFSDLETGKITSMQFWTLFNNKLGTIQHQMIEETNEQIQALNFSKNFLIEKIPEIHTDLFRLFFHPSKNLQTIELIKELKKKHRVICGTNTIQSHWENHMERGDYSFFNQTYASNKIGVAKPDKEFFTTILEAENAIPEETFFTDDKEENCKAAAECKIKSVHFTSAEELRKQWEKYL